MKIVWTLFKNKDESERICWFAGYLAYYLICIIKQLATLTPIPRKSKLRSSDKYNIITLMAPVPTILFLLTADVSMSFL